SSFHTSTASNRRFLASCISRDSSGRLALAPLQPVSTYSAWMVHGWSISGRRHSAAVHRRSSASQPQNPSFPLARNGLGRGAPAPQRSAVLTTSTHGSGSRRVPRLSDRATSGEGFDLDGLAVLPS